MKRFEKLILFIIVFCMIINLCPLSNVFAAKGDLGEGYGVTNPEFTFTTVDGEQISSASNGKVKVIVFGRTDGSCYNSKSVMMDICSIGWSATTEIDTLIVDIDRHSAETVKNDSLIFDPWIVKFCYDETNGASDLMWNYLSATSGSTSSVTLPVVVVIDKNNKVQYCKTGYISAADLYKYIEPLLNGDQPQEEEEEIVGKDSIKIYSEGFYDYDSAEEVFRLTNEARVSEGKKALVLDEHLTEVAMHRAAEQALLYNHVRPNGTNWYTVLTGNYLYGAGENIAYGQSSATSVTNAWLASTGHRENIMNSSYSSVGIGSFTHNGTKYWVQIFSSYSESEYADKSSLTKEVQLEAIPQNVGDFVIEAYDNELKPGEKTNIRMYVYNITTGNGMLNVKANNVRFKSSDDSIATVDSNGNITAVSEGTVKLTAILDETLIAKCELKVISTFNDNNNDNNNDDNNNENDDIIDDKLPGDVDGNTVIDAADALEALKYAARLRSLNEKEFINADVNFDSKVDSSDALLILKYAAKIIDSL